MEELVMKALGQAGAFCAISIACLGSAFGCGIGGSAAIGAWKKCFIQNKPVPFQLLIFAGSPLSQPIYGMILMFIINTGAVAHPSYWPFYLIVGITSGLAMAFTSWWQGVAAAAACDAFAETGKGFVNNLMIIGVVETVSIFALAFGIVLLSAIH